MANEPRLVEKTITPATMVELWSLVTLGMTIEQIIALGIPRARITNAVRRGRLKFDPPFKKPAFGRKAGWRAPPKGRVKRPCLRCRALFAPSDKFNRLCCGCNRTAASASPYGI